MAGLMIFVVHPSEEYCKEISKVFLDYRSDLDVVCMADLREAPGRVQKEKPAIVVVGVDTPNDPALKTIEAISAVAGNVGIMVVSKEPSQELLVSCMRAGSDEFLEFPIHVEELARSLEGLFKRKGVAGAGKGKVIAVFSASGGVGVTMVACNLAAGIAAELNSAGSCCIVDMNLQFGAVALAMDVREISHTLADVSQEQERLDANLLATFTSRHDSGVSVLPAPLSLEELEAVDPWHLRGVIQTCRKTYQYTILDMPHAIDDCSIVGLDEADEVLIVCDMVLPTIRNTIRALAAFRELDYKKEKFRLIINRFYDSHQVSLDEIVGHVELPVHWLIPYDSEATIASLNSGQMLGVTDSDCQVANSLAALAKATVGASPERKAPKKKRGLLGWVR